MAEREDSVSNDRLIGGRTWTLLIPAAVIAWRIYARPPASLWRDWVLIVGLFWIYENLASKARAWPSAMIMTMAYLLGIYVVGQAPHALSVLGLAP